VEPTPRTPAATYDRTIAASVARIWENVLDWEHLPWLHRTSFGAVRLLDESPAGWRGWVTTRTRPPFESLVDVRLDRPALRYLTRTVEGEGAGTEIWTTLEPADGRATRIRVAFAFPDLDPDRATVIGSGYVDLYRRLWDEDEAMMVRRQALLDEGVGRLPSALPAGDDVPLGAIGSLRTRLPLTLRVRGRELRLIELDGEIHAYPTVCPHLGGPLGDAAVEDGRVTCPWHGYRYDLRSGDCVSGAALRLGSLPRVRLDEERGEAALVW
jgi:nitrite reductase/ring-hydroxylating ferredoxin subunit